MWSRDSSPSSDLALFGAFHLKTAFCALFVHWRKIFYALARGDGKQTRGAKSKSCGGLSPSALTVRELTRVTFKLVHYSHACSNFPLREILYTNPPMLPCALLGVGRTRGVV